LIPLEHILITFEDIKSYGELPFASSGTKARHPMVSSGEEIISSDFFIEDSEIIRPCVNMAITCI
jgi:hypothetical protein